MQTLPITDERLAWWAPQPQGNQGRFERFPRQASKVLSNQIGPLANLRSSPGCALVIRCDAPWIELEVARLRHHQPVDQSFELAVFTSSKELHSSCSATASDSEGTCRLRFSTGLSAGTVADCWLWSPTISTFALVSVSVDPSATIEPATVPSPRWLAIGDSGSQGFVVDRPRQCWVHRLSEQWQLPVWNLGVGGIRIEPEVFSWAISAQSWDLITIGLGANHGWRDEDVAIVDERARQLLDLAVGAARQVAWIIPPWKAAEDGAGPPDFMGVPLHGAAVERMERIRDDLRAVLADYPNVIVIEDAVPHDPRLLPDGLHPTGLGSARIAERIAAALKIEE